MKCDLARPWVRGALKNNLILQDFAKNDEKEGYIGGMQRSIARPTYAQYRTTPMHMKCDLARPWVSGALKKKPHTRFCEK